MLKSLAAATLLAVIAAAPADSTTTYDAFGTFNGIQGAGNFTYGSVDDALTAGTLFGANTNCFIAGSICLQAAANADVPGATKSTMASFQYNSVNVPTDRLLVHPGPTAADGGVFITFTAPITGNYHFTSDFSIQDIHPTGVTTIFRYQNGANPAVLFGGSTLNLANPTFSYSGTQHMDAGDVFSVVVNRDGNYGSDSTGVNFTLSVPEPTSWALLIAGFGLVGAAARHRRRATVLTA